MKRHAFLAAAGAASVVTVPRPARLAPMPQASVTLGDEVFLRETWEELRGRTVGVVTNQTGVTSQLDSIVDAIRRNPHIRLRALYAPEHGLRGDRSAGAYVGSYADERTGLPVYSLYGATRKPNATMLAGIDVLLFDIQDVGARTYTYVSTMAEVMQAGRDLGKEIWVLDRPNPITADIVEGPVLDPAFSSFIGLYPIAMRHGMTVGELARMFNDRFGIGCKLRVVAMRGYRRRMLWPETGLAWVQTSPNIPEWDTTLVYPTTGLLDAAGVNNATNTQKPFKYAGGYRVDGARLAERLNARLIPGAHFRPAAWSPLTGFWAGKTLSGVEIVVTDGHAYRAVRTALEILVAMRALAPHALRLQRDALDRDWGTDSLRRGLEAALTPEEFITRWQPGTETFRAARERYLLYEA